jgi:hypothetical protein
LHGGFGGFNDRLTGGKVSPEHLSHLDKLILKLRKAL